MDTENPYQQKELFTELHQHWHLIGKEKSVDELKVELDFYKKMLEFTQIGDSYYFIFNPPMGDIEFASKNLQKVIGHEAQSFTIDKLFKIIHPDDLQYFYEFEKAVVNFKMELPPQKITRYKSRYNYRLRKTNGEYLHILQQSITIQSDEDGAALRNLVIHTDITNLNPSHVMTLSFIGMGGELSYMDFMNNSAFLIQKSGLTKMELKVLKLLVHGKTNPEVAEILFISPLTVKTHRRNIQKKTGTKSLADLIELARINGWM